MEIHRRLEDSTLEVIVGILEISGESCEVDAEGFRLDGPITVNTICLCCICIYIYVCPGVQWSPSPPGMVMVW